MNTQAIYITAADTVSLQNLISSSAAANCLAQTSARRLNVAPIALWQRQNQWQLVIACENPDDETLKERLRKHIPESVDPVLVRSALVDISAAIEKCYRAEDSFCTMISACCTAGSTQQILEQQPDFLIRLIERLLLKACQQRASDIHMSPDGESVDFRFRVDGVLTTIGQSHLSLVAALLVRIKVLASLDIAESRLPQDGQFSQLVEGHKVDFRVSTFPTIQGENTVLRVLSEQTSINSLESLALPRLQHQQLAQLVQRPDGLILVCGPTGSGKSTTLHSLLNELDRDSLNIMTLEDPVERSLSGIRQTSIDAERKLDYAQGVRALLRQDPDVLLIGEIRDAHSCSMSLRAVTTGHLVLTTVHASTVFGALTRLRELGAQAAVLGSNLVAIASQRLLRKRCQQCSKSCSDCTYCHGLGYQGRQVVMELLVITPELKTLIAADAPMAEIEALAIATGFIPLHDQAALLVNGASTTEDEVQRVLGRL